MSESLVFFSPALSSELPNACQKECDAPERFASKELLPIITRKWRRIRIRPTKTRSNRNR